MEIVVKNGEPAISIMKSPEQFADAKKLSEFIAALPLSSEQNNELIRGIMQQVELAEQSGFRQGVGVGMAIKTRGSLFSS